MKSGMMSSGFCIKSSLCELPAGRQVYSLCELCGKEFKPQSSQRNAKNYYKAAS